MDLICVSLGDSPDLTFSLNLLRFAEYLGSRWNAQKVKWGIRRYFTGTPPTTSRFINPRAQEYWRISEAHFIELYTLLCPKAHFTWTTHSGWRETQATNQLQCFACHKSDFCRAIDISANYYYYGLSNSIMTCIVRKVQFGGNFEICQIDLDVERKRFIIHFQNE